MKQHEVQIQGKTVVIDYVDDVENDVIEVKISKQLLRDCDRLMLGYALGSLTEVV